MTRGKDWFDCAIIGAGASGMMAAITAAKQGARVLLIEHGSKAGRKLLATGNGKCNFTNEYMNCSCYRGDDSLFPILDVFSKDETISFFHEIGVYPKNKRGYYYPNSEQAQAVVSALGRELNRHKVVLQTGTTVMAVEDSAQGFLLTTDQGRHRARTLIFATGLLASPKLGSDGSAMGLIKSFGHHFTTLVPALCGFYGDGFDWKATAGVRCDAKVTILVDGSEAAEDTGELQLTDYGISGIPVFQVSRYASMGLAHKRQVEASIRFLPGLSEEMLTEELQFRLAHFPSPAAPYDLLDGLVHQKLIAALLSKTELSPDTSVTEIGQLRALIKVLLDCRVTLTRPRDYEFAQICAGGIVTEDISPDTLMSKLVPGLFFCGELLDVDGICGGYNLQWAWSSGYASGKHAAEFARGLS